MGAGPGFAGADAVHTQSEMAQLLPQADIVVLTCPLTPDTEGLINAGALAGVAWASCVSAARTEGSGKV